MNGKVLDGTSHPIFIQLADRGHYERKHDSQTLLHSQSPQIESPCDITARESFSDSPLNHQLHYLEYPIPSLVVAGPPTVSSMTYTPTLPFFEYAFEVSGLSPNVTALQLCTIFAQFGQILAIRLETALVGPIYLCTGFATLHLYGSLHLRDSALHCLNGAHLSPFDGPMFVSLRNL
jgi:hypothetical protein